MKICAENMKEVEKGIKDAQGRLQSFEDDTKINSPHTVNGENAHATQRQEFRTAIEKEFRTAIQFSSVFLAVLPSSCESLL